ncbi:MAG: hypothetical protein Q9225_007036, partial [Loekoesia sp. 1 TL-2023]
SEKDPLISLAKSMERRRCNHHELDDPLSTLECLSNVIDPKESATNRNRYVVASQEEEVRRFCRGLKGVPLVYVKRSVMILEPMAEGSIGMKEGIERDKFRTGLRGKLGKRKRDSEDVQRGEDKDRVGNDVANGEIQGSGEKVVKKKKTHGPKGPNPLSVKKPKKEKVRMEGINDEDPIAAGGKPKEVTANAAGMVQQMTDSTEAPPGKRKRKRKHKSGVLEELEQELAENGNLSS